MTFSEERMQIFNVTLLRTCVRLIKTDLVARKYIYEYIFKNSDQIYRPLLKVCNHMSMLLHLFLYSFSYIATIC